MINTDNSPASKISGSKSQHLGILHPQTLTVYSLVTISGSTEHGDQSQVIEAYSHQLKSFGYCLVAGGFGGSSRDFILVQGLDGTLVLYEQETFSLATQLPSFLLPSPMLYVPHTDSFIVLNADWHLQSFRYQSLSETDPSSKKKLIASWSFNLGESVQDMHYLGLTTTEAAIVVVAERHLYQFRENGTVTYTKRFQFTPVCSTAFTKGAMEVMVLIMTDTDDLMIYEGTSLKWSAQLSYSPIVISRLNVLGIPGLLVALTEAGQLSCFYLGTSPNMFTVPPLKSKLQSIPEMEAKLNSLSREVAALSNTKSLREERSQPDTKLSVKVWPIPGGEDTCRVEIQVSSLSTISNVNISLITHHPITAHPDTHYFSTINGEEEAKSIVNCSEGVTSCLEIEAIACYMKADSRPGISRASATLPLNLVLELAPPVQDAQYQLILSCPHPLTVNNFFTEFSQSEEWNEMECNEGLAGFRFKNTPDSSFTLYLNRNHLKYRLETNRLPTLALPLSVLIKKLKTKKLETTQYGFALEYLLRETEQHVNLRNALRRLQVELKEGSGQMRAVQRRLLAKLKDKNLTDIKPLHNLISVTHNIVMTSADKIEQIQQELVDNGHKLSSLIRLILNLLYLNKGTSEKEIKKLSAALSSTYHLSENQGWAEVTEAAICQLLRNDLVTSVRDQHHYLPTEGVVTEPAKLSKIIARAVDLVARGPKAREERAVSPILEGETEDDVDTAGSDLFKSDFNPEMMATDENDMEDSYDYTVTIQRPGIDHSDQE